MIVCVGVYVCVRACVCVRVYERVCVCVYVCVLELEFYLFDRQLHNIGER